MTNLRCTLAFIFTRIDSVSVRVARGSGGGADRALPALLVFCLLVGSGGIGSAAEVYLGVTRSAGAKIPLGILGVQAVPELGASATTLRTVIESDLRRSHLFDVMPIAGAQHVSGPPDAARVKQAAASGVDAVVWGRVTRERDGRLSWEGYGYDGGNGALIVQKRYVGAEDAIRSIAHKFANAIVTAYTGEKGIAETEILFVSDESGSPEIYLMDYDGARISKRTNDRSIALTPRWSADKRLLSYVSYRGGQPSVYSFVLASGRRWQATRLPGMTISPAWSPAGGRLAFASNTAGNFDLYLGDGEGNVILRLTFGGGEDLSPAWSPTGLQLAYTSDRGGSPQIYVMDADGTNSKRLTFDGSYNTTPVFSPNGDWIAYTCRVEGALQVCLISTDGARQLQLTTGPGENQSPSWSPGSRHVVFSSGRDGMDHLYTIGIDGTGEERLTQGTGNHRMPSWSPY